MRAFRIAVAGKGGVGKTTFSGMLIHTLVLKGKTPVLAVDADPNSNLDMQLGLEKGSTVSDLRDSVLDKKVDDREDIEDLEMADHLASMRVALFSRDKKAA